jgi:hypothetical protein
MSVIGEEADQIQPGWKQPLLSHSLSPSINAVNRQGVSGGPGLVLLTVDSKTGLWCLYSATKDNDRFGKTLCQKL